MNLFELCKDFCISTVYTVDYDEIGMPDICHESVLCNKDSFKAQVAKYNLACMEHDEALKNYSQCRAEFREFIINSFFGFFRTKKA
jgi:hypothetical protein